MDIFTEISIVIVIATVISALMKVLKQPMLIGYILTGVIVGPAVFGLMQSAESFEIFSQFGVALLLFIVGLNLSPKVIREVGKVAVITGLGQVLFTCIVGYMVASLLGFSLIESLYIAVALTFSSTIIILKLLTDKGDLDSLYGKISVGFLLVQDILATIFLVIVSASALGNSFLDISFQLAWKSATLVIILYLVIKFLLPKLSGFFAVSQEFLFLFSIGWGLGLAAFFHALGLSIEIGALVAGVTLSLFPYHYEISSKMRPLRDFFLILFFVLLGSRLMIGNISEIAIPAIIFSLFVLIGNPLIVMSLMGFLRFNKKTGFMAGLTVAQISEFSLILIALGYKLGHLSEKVVSLVTVVGLVTIAGSSYMIMYSNTLYKLFSKYLNVFERKVKIKINTQDEIYDSILFGYNRIGFDFLGVFRKIGAKYLIIDYDPDVINDLESSGVNCKYGDASDNEFLDELSLKEIKMVISTIPDYEVTISLVDKVRSVNDIAIIMVISHSIDDAYRFYEHGASYVVMPHFLGGTYASGLVEKHKFDKSKFDTERENHIKHLGKRRSLGHEHPSIEKNG
ncbi:sodium:proton exchanger [candidate division WWE3 bacterium CG_4_9_14_0_2_um_filter_35_11]|uniref:Sodium:proton exchanger n=1 Tax=candidate division WWE3 bacterium CG_4_9_14_0_2_um_filter_35_11 TaxID=1975077 RepID=A0A2M8EMQ5_UNCKA|nr:MAG: sodium:proton exchanger [candidate division WWE3 bacterium CG_4_9_14_0_2_um_filter_35_11]